MNAEQRKRDASRSYANQYRKRGKLVVQPCQVCGDPKSQMHHVDYERPLDVTWLCKAHHLEWHRLWRTVIYETFQKWLGQQRHAAAQPQNLERAA